MVEEVESLTDLKAKIESAKELVVIDFYATWSAPCKLIDPLIEGMSKGEFSAVLFLKVDVDANEEAAQEYNIDTFPTYIFLKSGKTLGTMEGADVDQLMKLINEHK